MVAKALHVHPIETAEVPCIVEPDADFANVVQGATCQGQCLLNADKNLACLRFNAPRNDFPLVIGGYLSGDKYEVASACGG